MKKSYEGINKKKSCMYCGCHLAPHSESDICEVCLDELYSRDPGEPEEVVSCYEYLYL